MHSIAGSFSQVQESSSTSQEEETLSSSTATSQEQMTTTSTSQEKTVSSTSSSSSSYVETSESDSVISETVKEISSTASSVKEHSNKQEISEPQIVSEYYVQALGGEHYTYCPSCITEGSISAVFYCQNKDSGIVRDHIYSDVEQNGVKRTQIALAPGTGWDNMHVCDPTVIKMKTTYKDKAYNYVMFYLGCSTTNCKDNRIGIALSNSLSEKFIRPDNNMLLSIDYDPNDKDSIQWGVGQASAIALDDTRCLLFYTKGDPTVFSTFVCIVDLADMQNIKISESVKLSKKGINTNITNADLGYDNKNKVLYMICDKLPFTPSRPEGSIVWSTQVQNLADLKQYSDVVWEQVKTIDNKITGYPKNHNCGFIRDSNGYISGSPRVLATVSTDYLWGYRIKEVK